MRNSAPTSRHGWLKAILVPMLVIAMALTAVGVQSPSASAQEGSAPLAGSVTSNGSPIVGATVTSELDSGVTGSLGDYAIQSTSGPSDITFTGDQSPTQPAFTAVTTDFNVCDEGFESDPELGGLCTNVTPATQGPDTCPETALGTAPDCYTLVAKNPGSTTCAEGDLVGTQCAITGADPEPTGPDSCPTNATVFEIDDECFERVDGSLFCTGTTTTDTDPTMCREPVDLVTSADTCADENADLIQGVCRTTTDAIVTPGVCPEDTVENEAGECQQSVPSVPGPEVCPAEALGTAPNCYVIVDPIVPDCPDGTPAIDFEGTPQVDYGCFFVVTPEPGPEVCPPGTIANNVCYTLTPAAGGPVEASCLAPYELIVVAEQYTCQFSNPDRDDIVLGPQFVCPERPAGISGGEGYFTNANGELVLSGCAYAPPTEVYECPAEATLVGTDCRQEFDSIPGDPICPLGYELSEDGESCSRFGFLIYNPCPEGSTFDGPVDACIEAVNAVPGDDVCDELSLGTAPDCYVVVDRDPDTLSCADGAGDLAFGECLILADPIPGVDECPVSGTVFGDSDECYSLVPLERIFAGCPDDLVYVWVNATNANCRNVGCGAPGGNYCFISFGPDNLACPDDSTGEESGTSCRRPVALVAAPLGCEPGFGLIEGECLTYADAVVVLPFCPEGSTEDDAGACRQPETAIEGALFCQDETAELNGNSCVLTANPRTLNLLLPEIVQLSVIVQDGTACSFDATTCATYDVTATSESVNRATTISSQSTGATTENSTTIPVFNTPALTLSVVGDNDVAVEVPWDGSNPAVIVVAPPLPTCNGQLVTINMQAGDSGNGTNGDDVILGTNGNDRINGRGGNDTICGLDGDDNIRAGSGNDTVLAGAGNDYVRGDSGTNDLRGEAGNDTIRGGWGVNVINGGSGNDNIRGSWGNDTLNGGDGNDNIRGDFGNDTINGDAGNDTCRGGFGRDTVVCETTRR